MAHKHRHSRLTKEQIRAMACVFDGGHVYNRSIAVRLREVQKDHPQMIMIDRGARHSTHKGARPYFAAMLTAKGREKVEAHR